MNPDPMPWWKSSIIQQQVVMVIVAIAGIAGVTLDVDVNQAVAVIFSLVPLALSIWTILTRLFKATPPITERAAAKEAELIATGTYPALPMAEAEAKVAKNLAAEKRTELGETTGRPLLGVLLAVGAAFLVGCASFGTVVPQGFTERLAAGYEAISTIRDATADLVDAGTVTVLDARAVQAKADQARGLLDLAARVHEGAAAPADVGQAESVLARALGALATIDGCVDFARVDFSRCIQTVEVR